MELASVVIVPDDISISKPSFTSLCHTSCRIVQKGLYTIIYECICDVLVTHFNSIGKMWHYILYAVQPAITLQRVSAIH